MIFESLIRRVIVFWSPADIPCGLAKPGTALVGVCVAVTPTEPTKRGAIPDCLCVLRGRSGREVTVSFVESRCQPFGEAWEPAIKYASEQ